MATALIVVGVILMPVLVIFVRGFIKGWREYQPPPPSLDLWYDLVWGRKPKPKHKPKLRVLWPPPNEEER